MRSIRPFAWPIPFPFPFPFAVALALGCAVQAVPSTAAAFQVDSPDVRPGGPLLPAQQFNGFGCSGGNRSPTLRWGPLPAGTRSIAVTLYDPDAPTGSGWWHWQVFDIPPATRELVAGAGDADGLRLPVGARMGRSDFGTAAFGGACPPPGDRAHRYVFTVHALKVPKLDLPPDASAAMVGYLLNANTLATGRLVATFGRPPK